VALSDGDARTGVTMARRISVSYFWLALACVLFSAPIAANETAEPSATELIEGLLSGARRSAVRSNSPIRPAIAAPDADFQGKLVVIYFGYTYCPDVCPTELQSISLRSTSSVQPPIQYNPCSSPSIRGATRRRGFADFVSSFHPRLIGLTGSLAEIRQNGDRLQDVLCQKRCPPRRTIIRSTIPGFIYLLGKDGRYLGFLPPGLAPDAIADAIRARLGEK